MKHLELELTPFHGHLMVKPQASGMGKYRTACVPEFRRQLVRQREPGHLLHHTQDSAHQDSAHQARSARLPAARDL